ncbi:cell division protein FtsL [Fibrobacterota bacterium]
MKSKSNTKQKLKEKVTVKMGGRFLHFFRYFLTAAILIAVVVILPLSLVWKQVYITRTSIHTDMLQDSLAVLNKEIAALNIKVERLSGTERIETIAREALELDYPSSKEIVVVRPGKKGQKDFILDSSFWAVIRKSLKPEKG